MVLNAGMDDAVYISDHSTKGGVSDAELNELIVSPNLLPSGASAVTTATPVAKRPSASRKSRSENSSDGVTFRGAAGKGRFTTQRGQRGAQKGN